MKFVLSCNMFFSTINYCYNVFATESVTTDQNKQLNEGGGHLMHLHV